ncbi:SDR family NAD(P)-dependent oxidoreductase [Limnobacter humi]|uniref:SDR family NAD(P)-dependent oxidoreductase n=1 Tax=Limnobacter humi TaxID=1778671 RepID=A0ABT1WF39_9BURK|nr:SDR family NAD(P)-dependent oxidoreductase [Limnobacter humi]MCQ8896133.1 SDR family NAD(P)-dependent oxidoreductase [Limnobacter humi]
MKLDNAVAVVTGGASGLGLATVEAFLAKGANVAVFDMNEAAGQAVADAHPGRVIFQKVNVADADSATAGIAATMAAFGAIHVAVNCAGVGTASKILDRDSKALPLEAFNKTIQVNLVGTFNICRLAAEEMAKNAPDADGQRGVLINTASVAAFDGQTGQCAYSASKGGVVGMTLPMARDLSRYGIRVNTIAPGIFDTPMMKGVSEEYRQPLIAMVQNPKRFGDPAEYGQLCVTMVENNYLNAETIRLDGGIRMAAK